jgi:hypothetical protein
MVARPRKNRYESITQSQFGSTSELVHHLLVSELGAVLVPETDKTAPEIWAKPLEKEEEDMGLFDQYAAAGVDLGDIELSFNYKDGIYCMAFTGAELQEARQKEWGMQIEVRYLFVGDANGNKHKYTGKVYTEWLSLPAAASLKSDDEDVAKRANGALTRTFQRLYQLGIEDPQKMDLADLNKFKGNRYIVPLNTPKENNDKGRQYVGIVRPFDGESGANTSTANIFDDEN